MAFDPRDRADVNAWLCHKLAASKTDRYTRSPEFAVRNFIFDARQEARKARRQQHHIKGACVPVFGMDALNDVTESLSAVTSGFEFIEELAVLTSQIGLNIVIGVTHARNRKAEAILTCFGRLAAILEETIGHEAAFQFTETLTNHSTFLQLPLTVNRRAGFRNSVMRIVPHGNLRLDLASADLHWPSAKSWRGFIDALRSAVADAWHYGDN